MRPIMSSCLFLKAWRKRVGKILIECKRIRLKVARRRLSGMFGEHQRNFMKTTALVTITGLLLAIRFSATANDWPQWRGPQRNGVSQETGLLKEWPKDGPKLQWKATEIGSGYSTPAVVGERLYVLANEGLDNEFVEALDAGNGK